MTLSQTTPALPKNIHMSYEYELIVCQSVKEAIGHIKEVQSKHFLRYLGRGVGSRTPSTRLCRYPIGRTF